MQTSTTPNQERTDNQLRETAKRLNLLTLAEAVPSCDDCERHISEGQSITLYMQRTPDGQRYVIDEIRCEDHHSEFRDRFEIGRQDIVVTGRVGECRDQATQTAWSVLIAPVIRLVSDNNWDHGSPVSYDKQPTDIEDPHSGYKYTVPGMTNPSRPPVGGDR